MKSVIVSLLLLFNFIYGANKIMTYEGKNLREGNGNGIEIHENYVKAGFRLKRIETLNEEYLKTITISNNEIYVGTGLSGKIYVFRNNKFKLFADSIDANVNIIKKFGSELYAGTSPEGILFIQTGNNKKRVKTGEFSINDIVKSGNSILLATSSNGKILSFNGKTTKLFHQFDATSVNRLILVKKKLYAFCSDPASVYLLDDHGGILHSYQFKENEIADVSVRNGTIFVAVNSKNDMGNTKGIIYKLNSDFSSCMKITETANFINSIVLFDKYILFSAGNRGVLYATNIAFYSSYPIKIRETDDLIFTKIIRANNRIFAISSHQGALYEIEPASYGYYITKPIYFGSPVKIFDIEVVGMTHPQMYYRGGNISVGDSINTPWSRYQVGTLAKESPILFLQLKVNLSADSRIYGFRIDYEKRSCPPVIDSIVLSPPGILYTDGFFRGYNKRAKRSKITRLKNVGFSIKNSAKDIENSRRSLIIYAKSEDNGSLFYSIRLKSLHLNKTYNVVKGDSNHFFILNTDRYPDGTYRLFISVRSENQQAVHGQTTPFLIDNTPPAITNYRFSKHNLHISLSDTTGIYDIKYCTNGSEWKPVYLKSYQIYKKKTNITIPIKKKPDFIIIKLTDIFGNTGYFTIKER